ncbi:MAG: aspartyl/asparaginyl beta-hydroxylase domain-containing protein [Acetobacteraceae bacterium]
MVHLVKNREGLVIQSSPAPAAVRQSLSRFGGQSRDAVERWLASKSLVETGEIISPAPFPWVAELEANWSAIRRELDAVMTRRATIADMRDLSLVEYSREKMWKVFVFCAYGARSEENCRRCPETVRLLNTIPDLELACFSILEPGAHLAAHRGAYKGLIRAHLGLIVPEPHALVRMAVGQTTIHWEEGKCVVFDDTYRHEVWNDTASVRVVLLIDVPRPFPPLLAAVNKAALRMTRLTPFAKAAHKRFRAWEKAYYGAELNRQP